VNSLLDRLKAQGVTLGAKNLTPPVKNIPIEQVIPGEYQSTIYGDIFRTEQFYPGDYIHGQVHLRSHHTRKIIAEWGRIQPLEQVDHSHIYFLDTETSGLAGGTGTYAFMVGIGHYTDEGFQLVQFFLRDPGEESALLAALVESLHDCRVIVTFNGKSFDVPLLNTRYTLQGLTSPVSALDHLDLLPLARRLWRDRLPSRALNYLEVNILGAARSQEEVPSWMVPELYFEYLKTHDARPLAGVFYHNAMDIVSLAALFSHTTGLLEDPFSLLPQPGLDLVALARLYEDLGHIEHAIRLYENGLEQGLPEEFVWATIQRFSTLFKRRRAWSQAVELWHKAADHDQLFAFIELAKYYEHEENNLTGARYWTQSAIDRIHKPDFPTYLRSVHLPELEHRLERLKRKDERGGGIKDEG
jgi:uncharacterized protein YprB with RNaseH-like and TPR domain